MRAILLATTLLFACGGKPKQQDTTPPDDNGMTTPPPDTSGNMVPPDKMDEIQKDLGRKRESASRCLSQAVDNKELPKQSKGKITLEITITGGKASNVKVISASLDSKTLHDCVIHQVQEIEFPQLPNPYETSYTYQFEAI
jgi:hypothetical protein